MRFPARMRDIGDKKIHLNGAIVRRGMVEQLPFSISAISAK